MWRQYHANPFLLADKVLATDLIFGTLLLHSLGGPQSGLGILLVFTACSAAILLPRKMGIFFAALATIAIVSETALAYLVDGNTSRSLAQAGLYGLASFFGAMGCSSLARWSREFELLAHQRVTDFKNLEQINELIIRRLRSGVLVIDKDFQIRLMNESAWFLLGTPESRDKRLGEVSMVLENATKKYLHSGVELDEPLIIEASQASIIPRFAALPGERVPGYLIFLEDTDLVSRRANALTINSLAKLSGSIAHEIRNPLAAISHAAQLLRESEEMSDQDGKLLKMISNHSHRMNNIVENILQLSRRERSRPEVIELSDWLNDLSREVRSSDLIQRIRLIMDLAAGDMYILFDRSQLHQVFWKLLENAAAHAGREGIVPTVTIRAQRISSGEQCILEIGDNGKGIPENILPEIFEPFYSTSKKGSGLGLYIAKQICEANMAELTVESKPDEGTRFKIRIPTTGTEAGFDEDFDETFERLQVLG